MFYMRAPDRKVRILIGERSFTPREAEEFQLNRTISPNEGYSDYSEDGFDYLPPLQEYGELGRRYLETCGEFRSHYPRGSRGPTN